MTHSGLRELWRTRSVRRGCRALPLGLAAILAVIVGVTSSGALARTGTSSCPVTGHLLAQRDGVVVWTAHRPDRDGNEGNVFMCASPSDRIVLLARSDRFLTSMVTDASVTQMRFAGRFVGFFLRTNVEVYSKFLVVLDRLRGQLHVKDLAECDNNDECTGPDMTSYRLAASGWVAELWPQVVAGAAGLLATDGRGHDQLDLTRISHLSLSEGILRWTDPFGVASVPLDNRVITPRAPSGRSACQLLTAFELARVLGPDAQTRASAGHCTYTSRTFSGRALTVALTEGLTPAQTSRRERALTTTPPPYCDLGEWWPRDDDFQVFDRARGNVCGYPGSDVHFVTFARGTEVSLDLTAPGSGAVAAVAHLSNAAVDRLFGVPIHRAP